MEPQLGENIGFVARAMSNFSIKNLRIVKPRDGWPNARAVATAAHGALVLNEACVYDDVQSAISDCNIVVATTARSRDVNTNHMLLDEFVSKRIKFMNEQCRVGIMLGRESSGLTNAEIALSNISVSIPTSDSNASMNIAHAAAVICYAISQGAVAKSSCNQVKNNATSGDVMHFQSRLSSLLSKNGFFNENRGEIMKKRLVTMINRMNMTREEINMMHGILSALDRSKN